MDSSIAINTLDYCTL